MGLEPLTGYTRPSESQQISASESFFANLKTRRTLRDFAPDSVPSAVIENCLRAAGTAPSGANLQPWHFVIVTDPGKKSAIRQAAEAEERAFYESRATQSWLDDLAPLGTDANKPFLEIAPCLIAVFAESFRMTAEGNSKKSYYVTESVGIAVGMLISALHLSGLATLTHTPSPMRFLNELLNRPSNERPFLLLVVGYPAQDAHVPKITKKALEEIATFV
jgi:iodotyrosine deiodinase